MKNKTKIEIIDETVEFYSKNPRSKIFNGSCKYKGPCGVECAFQRCVENDLSLKYEGKRAGFVIEDLGDKIKYKPGYEGYDGEFWNDIQDIHDGDEYWDKNKLNQFGENRVKFLKDRYK